jgi:hypothetical protein
MTQRIPPRTADSLDKSHRFTSMVLTKTVTDRLGAGRVQSRLCVAAIPAFIDT